MGHDRDPEEAGLPAEQMDVPVYHVPLHQGFRCSAIFFRTANFRKFFQVLPYLHKVCPRVLVWTIEDQLLHKLVIAAVHLDDGAN
jgi:hypothetical protein